METIAFIVSNDWMKQRLLGGLPPITFGTHNGYVAVPPTNKYHGKHYDKLYDEIEVHGGLTFSESVTVRQRDDISGLRINPKYVGKRNPILNNAEFLSEQTEIRDDWWIFGFDTNHYLDNEDNCNREYVVAETLKLQKQLEEE